MPAGLRFDGLERAPGGDEVGPHFLGARLPPADADEPDGRRSEYEHDERASAVQEHAAIRAGIGRPGARALLGRFDAGLVGHGRGRM